MTLTKKISRIGNSYGVILPDPVLKAAGISKNSDIEVSLKGKVIQLRLAKTYAQDQKVMDAFMGVLRDYDQTFKKLAE